MRTKDDEWPLVTNFHRRGQANHTAMAIIGYPVEPTTSSTTQATAKTIGFIVVRGVVYLFISLEGGLVSPREPVPGCLLDKGQTNSFLVLQVGAFESKALDEDSNHLPI